MMLRKGKTEDIASFVERAIVQAMQEEAEFVHIELKQHYILIRLQWNSRMKMIYQGPRGAGLKIMAYLKTASGMSAAEHNVLQSGVFTFTSGGDAITLPSDCKPYLFNEKIILSLQYSSQ